MAEWWEDPVARVIIIVMLIVIVLLISFSGFIFGGGQEGWRNNLSYQHYADKENNQTFIYIFNKSDENGLIKPKILTVESIVVKINGEKREIDVVDAPPLEPYADYNPNKIQRVTVTLDGYYEKLKVTKINYSYVLYEQEAEASLSMESQVTALLNTNYAQDCIALTSTQKISL